MIFETVKLFLVSYDMCGIFNLSVDSSGILTLR